MKFREEVALCFDDVLLIPQYSDIRSRKEIELSCKLANFPFIFSLPIISSPMDTVTEENVAFEMYKAGGLGILHRYNTIEGQVNMVKEFKKNAIKYTHDHGLLKPYKNIFGEGHLPVGVAVPATGTYRERITQHMMCGVRLFLFDIAHGDMSLLGDAIQKTRSEYGNDIHIMAGNVATPEAVERLAEAGADSVRLSVGSGAVCTTRIKSGTGLSTFQALLDCFGKTSITLIADGGIRTSGDIVKSLAVGADFAMLGSMLSATEESPGQTILLTRDGVEIPHKIYRGMASACAQKDWRGFASSVEGASTPVPCKGPISNILQNIQEGIASGLSYSGARTIEELQEKAEFVRVTTNGTIENGAHAK